MICKNLKELEKELYKRINIALDTDVADTVKDAMFNHIVSDVYDTYTPKMYQRRFDKGGLMDMRNIVATMENDGELLVQNVTLGNPYYYDPNLNKVAVSVNSNQFISPVIEHGTGYDVVQIFPRPFVQNTCNDLEQNHYHTEALKRSLKKQGLEVK